ncbi:hypothetical protein [Tsukamurella sp. PLM1]|uniref:hypothetical protein n=1 Tax=Tsukamurella sp. PLM1 TaxID=2929795 RepID=UPI00204CFFCE|nr:hypothetical protein [Tsukamurella sp. PLM1]BDH55674.1 hypothetical protein MTP03_06130 [Tsukamurella sp. PLM1]
MVNNLDTQTHTDAIRTGTPELVRQLNSHLGPTLVATLAGVRDRKLPHKWAKIDGPSPRPEALERLQMAHRVWGLIATSESDSIARAWFIGLNPRLGEVAPIMALRAGDSAAVWHAARAFVSGTDD